MCFLVEFVDVNFGGKVYGGVVMKWIDLCVYGCVVGWSGKYCIMVYVGGMYFVKFILVGSMVEVDVKVIYIGRIFMYLCIYVWVGDFKSIECELCIYCIVVMVVMDENGKLV